MAKFASRKNGRGAITCYDAHLGKNKLHEAGFIMDDGTLLDYEAEVQNGVIMLRLLAPDGLTFAKTDTHDRLSTVFGYYKKKQFVFSYLEEDNSVKFTGDFSQEEKEHIVSSWLDR